jgi:hypothetical protein
VYKKEMTVMKRKKTAPSTENKQASKKKRKE